jgi:hypothetical protein
VSRVSKPGGRTCATCPRPVRSQLHICRVCEAELRRRLANQAAYRGDLELEYLRMTQKAEAVRRRIGINFPILFEAQASKLLTRQYQLLRHWMRRTLEAHRRLDAPRHWTVPIMAGCLVGNLSVWRRKKEAGQMLVEFRDLDADVVALIDLDPMRTSIHVGPCPNKWPTDGGLEWCPGQVEARVPADEKLPAYMRCAACNEQWPSWQWSRTGAKIISRAEDLERQKQLALQMARGMNERAS